MESLPHWIDGLKGVLASRTGMVFITSPFLCALSCWLLKTKTKTITSKITLHSADRVTKPQTLQLEVGPMDMILKQWNHL